MKHSDGKRQYLYSVDFARCLALILLIAGHCSYNFEYRDGQEFHYQAIRNILVGNSILFVFLSGFLFEYLLHKGFYYQRFIKNKFITILLPYLILTTPLVAWKVQKIVDKSGLCDLNSRFDCFSGIARELFNFYLYGQAAIGHWFMPFIFLIFILVPVFLLFFRLSKSHQLIVILFLSAIALFVHRPLGAAGFVQNLLYFSGIFLLGMFTSKNYNEIQNFKVPILCVSGLLTVSFLSLQIYLGEPSGFKTKVLFEFNGIDWLYFQKIFLCFFLLFVTCIIFNQYNRYTQNLARMSFGMVLIHPYMMFAVNKFIREGFSISKPYPAGIVFLCYVIVVCVTTAVIVLLCKRVLGNKSRFITGY